MGRSEYTNELRNMSYQEVENILADKKMHMMKLRNDTKTENIKRTAEWLRTKKDIGRCMNVLTEKKREEIKQEYEREGKPLPKTFTPRLPRCMRVGISKEMLNNYRQHRKRVTRKLVVFQP